MTCAACGFDAQSDFAFCPRCGARLPPVGAPPPAPAPADTDRRLVTVLFADLSGFTALSERLDPEDVRSFQADLFEEMAGAIKRYDGFVEKFVGDAVMAVFGAPVAHEDDPERALRAALAMHERMADLNRRWQPRLGEKLALHVGVTTGSVVAGSLGATAGAAYAITGDTVNTASRLQSAAEPGHTLVSAATHRLTQHAFAFEALGDLALKGKAEPVAVYRVLAALGAPRSARGLEAHGLTAPLIGRRDELGQMLAAFDRMLGGRAQVLSLIGEAGAGKSRLLREFFVALEADRRIKTTTVRRAACSSLGEQPYGVVAALLREAYGITPDDTLETAQHKIATGLRALGADETEAAATAPVAGRLLGLEPGHPSFSHIEPEQLKRQIFLATRTIVERRLQHAPLVLVVEDLHWADAASIELLRFTMDRLADRQLMLLVTYRPSVDASALEPARAAHTAIRLAPLSPGQSGELLAALFGESATALPPRFRELIASRAGGNPFHLEEVVRGLIASGVLVRSPSGWTCAGDPETADVPPTIQGLLLSRIDHLPPEVRRLLQEAAVLGTTFESRLLRLIASEPGAYAASLDVLRDAEMLEAATGATHRFSHALVQEVVYQNLLRRRRTELHERAGQALETLCGGSPQRLEDLKALGHHFRLSADKPRGARYLMAAGDWARAVYANGDAIRHYESALETLRACESGEDMQLAAGERLGDLLGLTGRRDEALERYETVRRAHALAGDRPAEARVYRKTGALHWDAGDREHALACCESGLALLAGGADDIELANLYQEMGRMAFRAGDNQRALEWAERALAHAELMAGRPATARDTDRDREVAAAIAHASNIQGVALARMGRPEEAVAGIERSVAVAEAHGLLQAACRSQANLGVLYATLAPGRAIEACTRGLEMAKKIGDLTLQSRLYANLAVAYCALTNRCDEEGIGAARAAIELDRRLGQLDHLAVPLIVLGQIYQCHGQPRLALEHYREALALAEEVGEPQLLFPCYDGLATLYLDIGDDTQAEEYMRKAQLVCERAGLDPDSLVVLPFLG